LLAMRPATARRDAAPPAQPVRWLGGIMREIVLPQEMHYMVSG
jgi:hypothetical protein